MQVIVPKVYGSSNAIGEPGNLTSIPPGEVEAISRGNDGIRWMPKFGLPMCSNVQKCPNPELQPVPTAPEQYAEAMPEIWFSEVLFTAAQQCSKVAEQKNS